MMKDKIRSLLNFPATLHSFYSKVDTLIQEQKALTGAQLSAFNQGRTDEIISDIHKAEFKVFSQWGDDGIIQFLVNYLDIENKVFIEFGVEGYAEANTRFLLINNNWKGLIMDGSTEFMNNVRKENVYWKHNLTSVGVFIKKENINYLINDFSNAGLLHIDIDGNDYWIWEEIKISPGIIIVEYNSVFGLNPWTVPYDPDFIRSKKHYSNLFYGASISALYSLAVQKGYSFIGCNSAGNNAYFVRNDKMKNLKALTPEQGYVQSQFRESRDQSGNLTYLSGKERLEALKGQQVYNIQTKQIQTI